MQQLKRQSSLGKIGRRATGLPGQNAATMPRRLTQRRKSTVIPALGATRDADGGRVESSEGNDLHDALLNQ